MKILRAATAVFLVPNVLFTKSSRQCSLCQVENVVVEVPFPKAVLNVTLTPSQGKYSFDPVSKMMTWDVGKIDTSKLPNIKGNVSVCVCVERERINAYFCSVTSGERSLYIFVIPVLHCSDKLLTSYSEPQMVSEVP